MVVIQMQGVYQVCSPDEALGDAALPFTPLSMAFSGVHYFVPLPSVSNPLKWAKSPPPPPLFMIPPRVNQLSLRCQNA